MKRTRDFNTRTTCHYCGVSLIRQATPTDTEPFYENGKLKPEYGIFSYDHKTPHARGGTDDPSNLVTCCMKCNLEKGTSDYSIFYAATAPRRLSNLVLAFAGACKLSLDHPSQDTLDMLYQQANAIYKVISGIYPNVPPPPNANAD